MEMDTTGPGADPSQVSAIDNSAVGDANPNPAEPAFIEVDDNTLIKPKGSDKPVRYGDNIRTFQSQWTKAAQKAAALERELQARDERLRQIEAQQQAAARQPQGNGQPDIYEAIRSLQYLSGEDAVQVVQHIEGQMRQRDMVLLGALRQMQQMQKIVEGLNESATTSSFDAKISRWLEEGGYPPEAKDLAKEVYLAYTGDDLDAEFPRIFHDRWTQIQQIINAQRTAQLNANRRSPFVPGKGSNVGPSKPLQIPPDANAKAVTDLLWDSIQKGSDT